MTIKSTLNGLFGNDSSTSDAGDYPLGAEAAVTVAHGHDASNGPFESKAAVSAPVHYPISEDDNDGFALGV